MYHAIEVNIVIAAMQKNQSNGLPTVHCYPVLIDGAFHGAVVNRVLPNVDLDLVSWSSWDGQGLGQDVSALLL